MLVLELADGRDLFDRLKAGPNGHMHEQDVQEVAHQMAEVLCHLHNAGIAHLDVKPENIIFMNSTSNEVRLVDFGHATDKTPQHPKFTATYVAPEIILSMQSRRQSGYYTQFTQAADCWSLGVTLYVCLSGFLPFYSKQPRRPSQLPQDMRDMILSGRFDFPDGEWGHCSEEAKNVIKQLLNPDPSSRMSAQQLLQHAWANPHTTHHTCTSGHSLDESQLC